MVGSFHEKCLISYFPYRGKKKGEGGAKGFNELIPKFGGALLFNFRLGFLKILPFQKKKKLLYFWEEQNSSQKFKIFLGGM